MEPTKTEAISYANTNIKNHYSSFFEGKITKSELNILIYNELQILYNTATKFSFSQAKKCAYERGLRAGFAEAKRDFLAKIEKFINEES